MDQVRRTRMVWILIQRLPLLRVFDEWYARGFRHGYDVASARAESRLALGLPLSRSEGA